LASGGLIMNFFGGPQGSRNFTGGPRHPCPPPPLEPTLVYLLSGFIISPLGTFRICWCQPTLIYNHHWGHAMGQAVARPQRWCAYNKAATL